MKTITQKNRKKYTKDHSVYRKRNALGHGGQLQRKGEIGMSRKVIFLDIDGTLTEPGRNEPPESAVEAVRRARSAGNYVFLCTGRSYGMMSPLLAYGFDGVVASAGGYILFGDKVIYDSPLTEHQKCLAMDVLKENGIYRTIECRDRAYTDEGFKDFLRAHISEYGNSELLRWREQIEKSMNILPMGEYGGQPVYKLVVMSPSVEALEKAGDALKSDFQMCIQDGGGERGFVNGEVINRKVNKGTAVELVCEYLKIPLSDSVGFGDSMNDKEMLETAGLSMCMENGNPKLKKIVDDICPSVTEDGIWKAFQKYHLMQ